MQLSEEKIQALSAIKKAIIEAYPLWSEEKIQETVQWALWEGRRKGLKNKDKGKKSKHKAKHQLPQLHYLMKPGVVTRLLSIQYRGEKYVIHGWYDLYAPTSGLLLVQTVTGQELQLTPRTWQVIDGVIHQTEVVDDEHWQSVVDWIKSEGHPDLAQWVRSIQLAHDRGAPQLVARGLNHPGEEDPQLAQSRSAEMLEYTNHRGNYRDHQVVVEGQISEKENTDVKETLPMQDYFDVPAQKENELNLTTHTSRGRSVDIIVGYWATPTDAGEWKVKTNRHTVELVPLNRLRLEGNLGDLTCADGLSTEDQRREVVGFFQCRGHVSLAQNLSDYYAAYDPDVNDRARVQPDIGPLIDLKAFGVPTQLAPEVIEMAKDVKYHNTTDGWVRLPCLIWQSKETNRDRKVHGGRLVVIDGEAARIELEVQLLDVLEGDTKDSEFISVPVDELTVDNVESLGVNVACREPAGKHTSRWYDLAGSPRALKADDAMGLLARALLKMWVNPHQA